MKVTKRKIALLFVFLFSLFMAVPAAAETNFFQSFESLLAHPQANKPRILMIGNSLTQHNDLGKMLEQVCRANGIEATVESYTLGYQSLWGYAHPEQSPANVSLENAVKIHDTIDRKLDEKWDYVILQGRSDETVDSASRGKMLQALTEYFAPKIVASGAQMVLYMTWAPETNPYGSNAGYDSNARQTIITNVYNQLGKALNGKVIDGKTLSCAVAPVGIAFARARGLYPSLDLHRTKSDRLHPNSLGSYLSACTIYATLFQRNPYGTAYYPAGTSQEKCQNMQSIAADVTVRMNISSHVTASAGEKGYVLNKGKTKTITVSATNDGRVVSWASSNTKAVTVKSAGLRSVSAKAVGSGRSTITGRLNNNKTISFDIIVSGTSFTMGVNETYKLPFTNFKWTSSKSSVASVKNNAIVAHKSGSATLTGTDSKGIKIKLSVKVKSAPKSVKVSDTKIVAIGRTAKLGAKISSGTSLNGLTYKSSNPNIVSVDKTGVLTGKRVGKVKITATAYNKKKAVCVVQCIIPAQKIAFNNVKSSPITLKKGKSTTLKVSFTPSNATIRTLKWKTSNKKIVTVSGKGKITAKKKGTATISATTTDGTKKTVKIKVQVK